MQVLGLPEGTQHETTAAATCVACPAGRWNLAVSSVACRLQAQKLSLAILIVADLEDEEVCSKQKLTYYLPMDALGNSRISERSLGKFSVFMIVQKQETLNQTNELLQWIFVCKTVWEKKHYVTHDSFQWHNNEWIFNREMGKIEEQRSDWSMKTGRTRDAAMAIDVRESCAGQGNKSVPRWVKRVGGMQWLEACPLTQSSAACLS